MKNTWLRSVLGLGAVLLVAGPGMVLAVFDPSYTPRSLVVQGPGTLTPTSPTAQYTAFVTFTNNQTALLTGPQAGLVWTSSNLGAATVTSGGVATRVSPGVVGIQASFTQQGVKVGGVRLVRVQ